MALGSDFICRLGLATRPGENIHQYGWHLTTLYGYMTAAAVAGRLLGLDAAGLTNAIGIGYHQSSGNGQCVKDGALTKRMGPGMAVRGGIASALMAKRGITGARNSLEGKSGIYQVYHQGRYSREALVGDLGKRFESVNVSIKPYPCCRGVHPFIDAGLGLVAKHDIRPQDVEGILINCGEGTNYLLATPFEAKARPRTFVDSQFSIVWGVATAIARRRAGLDDFTQEAIESADILEVTAKISVEVDHDLDRGDVGHRACPRDRDHARRRGLHRTGRSAYRHSVAASLLRGRGAQIRRLPRSRRAAHLGGERTAAGGEHREARRAGRRSRADTSRDLERRG